MHWADNFAKEIAKTRKKDEFVVESGITPSGVVHIGNAREVMTQLFVHLSLQKLGKKSRFQYIWDDFDRFRKVPKGVDKSFEEHIGKPVSKVPDPFGCHSSYANHFKAKMEAEMKILGIEMEYLSATELYEKCTFAENVKLALEKTELIKEILNRRRKEDLAEDWLPIELYCEKCKRDSTYTKYLGGYEIEYSCDCGFSNKIDFRKTGIVKLKWRVDWPSRWAFFGVDFESSGKDHKASGGSWDTSVIVSKEIFCYEPPVGPMYEFIYLKGQTEKMSSSKGNIATISDLLEIFEPEAIRFMYTQRLKKAIFVPFDTDIYGIYDSFDAAEKAFYGEAKADEETIRRYELSRITPFEKCPVRLPFSELVSVIQTVAPEKLEGKIKELLDKKSGYPNETDFELAKLRVEKVKMWLEKYAPDEVKISFNEAPAEIDEEYRPLLMSIAEKISGLEDEEEILNETYSLIKSSGFPPKEIFGLLYKILIDKERGPRFGILVKLLGKERVIERLKGV
jgi:lysyl-tRNA synthetase class 1